MNADECRATGFHKWDDTESLRGTCTRCGVVRQAVRVSAYQRARHRVHGHLRWVYTWPKQDA